MKQRFRTMVAVVGLGGEQLPGTFELHKGFECLEVGPLVGVGDKPRRIWGWIQTIPEGIILQV